MAKRSTGRAAGLNFIQLAARALMSGLAISAALILITLGLATSARAASVSLNDAKSGALLLRSEVAGQYTVAPTVQTEVAISVTGMIARTRLTQLFHHAGSDFVEGIYVFPLPEQAAVDHLQVQIGERLIEGEIQAKDDARRSFERAKHEGRKAALLEQQRPNLFTSSVAAIGPNEMVQVRIEYQQSLAYENGEYRLRFPLAVAPRYVPASVPREPIPEEPKALEAAWIPPAPQDCDEPLRHPDYARAAGTLAVNPVDIAVLIDAGVALANVKSSYHEISIEKQAGHRTLVYLAKAQEEADHDFELSWSVAPANAPQAAVFTQTVAGNDYALVMVVPPKPDAAEQAALGRLARETILIIDTSGSMQGTSIAQAKRALIYALDTLTERDRFNVLEFNSVTRTLYPAALPATAQNVQQAKDWVGRLVARGGTEMAPALTFALDGGDTPGYLRQVIFMTDGGVSNEEELLGLIAARLGASRLFTVGIGSAPNAHFMTKAAQFGRGTFTYIADVREVHDKMARLFAKIEAPVLNDVSIRWPDGTPVETFPARLPDLYLGEPLVASAMLSRDGISGALATIIVSGRRGNQPWSVALAPTPTDDASGVGALWARAKIASLMDEIARGAEPTSMRPQVVKVALEHHLVSAYTSLVAVDHSPGALTATTRSALVAANLPKGWGGMGEIAQTDTAATLELLLALCALGTAALLAVGARAIRAGNPA